MRYIELNSVRAGMVKHPVDYPWSSYAANTCGKEDPLIIPHETYQRLGLNEGARRDAYQQLFHAAIDSHDLEAIRESLNKGWVLGNERFRVKIEQLSGRRASPKQRGRPRKLVESDG